jgi:hypothetical protein
MISAAWCLAEDVEADVELLERPSTSTVWNFSCDTREWLSMSQSVLHTARERDLDNNSKEY